MADALLPSQNSEPFELAVEETNAERYPLDIEALSRALDPYQAPVRLLPWLAYQVGTDLWFDEWPEDKKRRAIAEMPRLKKLKGTLAGIEGYLSLVDVPLLKSVLPPQGGYLQAPLTKEQREAWLSSMPQVRLFHYRDMEATRPGEGIADSTSLADSPENATAAGVDRAPLFFGEQAFLYRNGSEIPLVTTKITGTTYQIALPGTVSDAAVADGDRRSYASSAAEAEAGFLTIDLAPENAYRFGGLEITPIRPTLRAIDTRYELVAEETETRPRDFFCDSNALCDDPDDGAYAGADEAFLYFYQRIYLLDSNAPIPVAAGGFSADGFLTGMPVHHGILKVDVSEPATRRGAVADGGLGFLTSTDTPRLDQAVEAVRRAQGGTDVLAIDTEIFSPMTFGDGVPMDGSHTFGQMITRL